MEICLGVADVVIDGGEEKDGSVSHLGPFGSG